MFLCFFYSDNDSNSGNSSGKKDGNEIRKATRRSYPYPIDITNNTSSSNSSSNIGTSNSGLSVGAVAQHGPTTTITTTAAAAAAAAAAPTTTTTSNIHSNNLVAVKVVPKQEFWQRVLTGMLH